MRVDGDQGSGRAVLVQGGDREIYLGGALRRGSQESISKGFR